MDIAPSAPLYTITHALGPNTGVWVEHSDQSHEQIYLEPGTALCFSDVKVVTNPPNILGNKFDLQSTMSLKHLASP